VNAYAVYCTGCGALRAVLDCDGGVGAAVGDCNFHAKLGTQVHG